MGQPPITKNYPAQNVSRAEAENPDTFPQTDFNTGFPVHRAAQY